MSGTRTGQMTSHAVNTPKHQILLILQEEEDETNDGTSSTGQSSVVAQTDETEKKALKQDKVKPSKGATVHPRGQDEISAEGG